VRLPASPFSPAVQPTSWLVFIRIAQQLLSPDGAQLEAPDPWLERENPWEIPRLDVTYKVRFYGSAEKVDGTKGRGVWHGGQEVLAVAYDMPIPGASGSFTFALGGDGLTGWLLWSTGHGTKTTANIRLWAAKPITGFDLASFNAGSYAASVEASQSAQTITRVLYPNDSNDAGKELRLKQQYLWCAASLADIIRRFKKLDKPWDELPDYVAIQLNECVSHATRASGLVYKR
jgi:starch phosphorylase